MLKKYHEGILYPENTSEMIDKLGTIEKKERARAIILPHQAFHLSAELLASGCSHISGFYSSVIILSPLHLSRVESDKNYSFFEGEANKEYNIVNLGAKISEYYAEEEGSAEMLVPILNSILPSTPISIIYGDIKSAKESKELSLFLQKHSSSSTLFIISTNLSPLCNKVEEALSYKNEAINALENGDSILDLMNKNKIKLCGGGLVDSLNRVVKGNWILENRGSDNETTAHCVLWKKDEQI